LPPLLVPLSADLSALRSLFSPPPFSTPHRLTLEGNERLVFESCLLDGVGTVCID
jgi:hypothetical protein